MLSRSELFDAELVARLSRRELPGPPSRFPHRGVHQSSRRGASLEFSEHTEYAPGEDLRHLDWKVYAKSDRYFVKRYEDERLQRAVVLLDASGSMAYGAAEGSLAGSKYHFAARVAVALAASLLRQGDAVGLELAAGEERAYLPPRSGGSQLEALIEIVGGANPVGPAGLEASCLALVERLGRGSALFVLSDFLDESLEELSFLRLARARGLSPRAVQILHEDELSLPFENSARFQDLEGPASLVLDPAAVRRAYREEIRGFVEGLSRRASLLGVPFAVLTTGADPAPALARLVVLMGSSR